MNKDKSCFKCGEVKHLSEFYKHPQMLDGHVNKCKECNKADVRANRQKNSDYYREYDRARGNRQSSDYRRNYRNTHPMKYAAHNLVCSAVRDGRLSRPDRCQECGIQSKNIHGHHNDYAKPLEVRWLCPVCHNAWHSINGEGENSS